MVQKFNGVNFGKMEEYNSIKYSASTGTARYEKADLIAMLGMIYDVSFGRYVRMIHGDMLIFFSKLRYIKSFKNKDWLIDPNWNDENLLAFRVDADYHQYCPYTERSKNYSNEKANRDIIIFYNNILYIIDGLEGNFWMIMKPLNMQ